MLQRRPCLWPAQAAGVGWLNAWVSTRCWWWTRRGDAWPRQRCSVASPGRPESPGGVASIGPDPSGALELEAEHGLSRQRTGRLTRRVRVRTPGNAPPINIIVTMARSIKRLPVLRAAEENVANERQGCPTNATPSQGFRPARNPQASPEETDSALIDVKRRRAVSRASRSGSSPTGPRRSRTSPCAVRCRPTRGGVRRRA